MATPVTLATALDRIPDDGSDASAEKWYQRAEIARKANDDAGLSTILEHMRATTPKSPWLESALFSAGNMYLLRKDYDRAIDYYREIHERFPAGNEGRLRALEVRLADLPAESPGAGQEIFRGAGRVLSRNQRSPERHVLARPHGRGRQATTAWRVPITRSWPTAIATITTVCWRASGWR